MATDTKVQEQKEQLFTEFTLVVKTSLSCDTDADIDKRYGEVEDLIDRLETLIEHLFTPGGQYHIKGYSLKLARR